MSRACASPVSRRANTDNGSPADGRAATTDATSSTRRAPTSGPWATPVRAASARAARLSPPVEQNPSHQSPSPGWSATASRRPSAARAQSVAVRWRSTAGSTTGPVSVSTASASPAGHGPLRRIASTSARSTRRVAAGRRGRPTSRTAADRCASVGSSSCTTPVRLDPRDAAIRERTRASNQAISGTPRSRSSAARSPLAIFESIVIRTTRRPAQSNRAHRRPEQPLRPRRVWCGGCRSTASG